jgi:uncharacterized membrane protein
MKQNEHILEEHDPERRDFQIERLILFTDAVFAIAITLLVIEIKAPEVHGLPIKLQISGLLAMIPKFSGFTISFFVIAIYWRSHHRLFGFVTSYTEKLIWLNILFLFTVVLMPFSSAYYSENFGEAFPFIFYNMNVVVMALANYGLISCVFNPANKLVKHQPTDLFIHLFKSRAIAIPTFFFCCALAAVAGVPPLPMMYILIWPMLILLKKYHARKYKSKPAVVEAAEG